MSYCILMTVCILLDRLILHYMSHIAWHTGIHILQFHLTLHLYFHLTFYIYASHLESSHITSYITLCFCNPLAFEWLHHISLPCCSGEAGAWKMVFFHTKLLPPAKKALCAYGCKSHANSNGKVATAYYSILCWSLYFKRVRIYANIICVFLCVCARLSQYALQIAEEWLRADSAAQLSISRNGSKMRCFISGVQNQFRSRKTCWQRADFCCVLQILLECLRQCWCLLQLRAPSELLQQACCGPFMFCRSEWGEVGPGSVFDFPK